MGLLSFLQSQSSSRSLRSINGKCFARGREVILAGTTPAEAFKRLYYSHRASPLPTILSLQVVKLLARLDQIHKSLEDLARETKIRAIPFMAT